MDLRAGAGPGSDEPRPLKRAAEQDNYGSSVLDPSLFADLQPVNFHSRPLGGQRNGAGSASQSRKASGSASQSRSVPQHSESLPSFPTFADPSLSQDSQRYQEQGRQPVDTMFNHSSGSGTLTPQTYDILAAGPDLSQFRSPPGSSGGMANFTEL